jgi:hypothetical protein
MLMASSLHLFVGEVVRLGVESNHTEVWRIAQPWHWRWERIDAVTSGGGRHARNRNVVSEAGLEPATVSLEG